MTEHVDRDALRTKLEDAIGSNSHHRDWCMGVRYACSILNEMPTVEVPRGWSRDELLAAMDAGTVVDHPNGWGEWRPLPRSWIGGWPDDVVSYDVRVVAPPEPKTEDVPLHEVVGRKLPDHDDEIEAYIGNPGGVFVQFVTGGMVPVPLNADGTVTVAAREA